MSPPAPHPPPTPAERRRFILCHGILRYGILLGGAIFAWIVSGEYAGPLEHLHTRTGWLRLAFLLLLCVGEWVIGAGWLIGRGLWFLRQHPLAPDQSGIRSSASRSFEQNGR
jgi:hypothetical protein